MATQLKNIVRFVNVAPGATVQLPHGLSWSPPGGGDLPQVPDVVWVASPGWTVTADVTNVTATNDQGVVASVDCYAVLWHTFERDFGNKSILELVPRPLIINPGILGGIGSDITYLPDRWEQMDVPASQVNVPLPSSLSQLFDEIPVTRLVSILGLRTQLTEAIVAGSLEVRVFINGLPSPAFMTYGAGSSGAGTTFPPGLAVALAGQTIGVRVSTSVDFEPADSIDLSSLVEVGAA